MLLTLDTSTNWASIAVLDGDRVAAHHGWAIGQQHGAQIFAGIDQALALAGIDRAAIMAIAVATGPGSFNGVRVAITVAKTLAYCWSLPLAGISTLDGMAQAASMRAGMRERVLALLEAGREELYTGWYDIHDATLVARQGEIAITPISELLNPFASQEDERQVLVVGEVTAAHRAQFDDAWGTRAHWADPPDAPDRAMGLGQLAVARFASGQGDAPLVLEPTYIRRPNITLSARHPVHHPMTQANDSSE